MALSWLCFCIAWIQIEGLSVNVQPTPKTIAKRRGLSVPMPKKTAVVKQGMPAPMPKELSAAIVRDMRSFVDRSISKSASQEKPAVLLTFGDSTMAGIATRLFEALHTVGGDVGLWNFEQCPGWGNNCKAFRDAPPFDARLTQLTQFKSAFESIRSAVTTLEKSNCTFGGHTFQARSYFKGKLIHYSWGFASESFGSCWKECVNDAIRALQPTAVFVNQGLHLLHAYPFRSCAATDGPVSYYDCGKHKDLVTGILRALRPITPISIWKTSNYVCDAKYYGGWRSAIDKWHNPQERGALEQACRKDCATFNDERPCGDELIDARSSDIQRNESLRAVAMVRDEEILQQMVGTTNAIGVVDAFSVTDGRCDSTDDGRHYRGLDPEVVRLMAAELARLA
jgi:hypothetical protein